MLGSLPENRIDNETISAMDKKPEKEPARLEQDFSIWRQEKFSASDANMQKREEETDILKQVLKRREKRLKEEADILLEKDSGKSPSDTTVVAVCSTKGGVGKTTISTQLASCLALTSKSRSRFRVCLVDYDIGFGDVCTMLDFDPKGPDMVQWAALIRDLLERGQSPEAIQFSQKEIESYLQCKKDSGLYALLSPVRHMDSIDIGADELGVMLRNIKEYGGFDFVVCDTSNDTNDAAITALDLADYILMIATQDVTCAHCLDSFLKTLRAIKFDLGKVRLTVNNVMSSKETGISVSEIKESFPFECWAVIKHDPQIIRSNNFGQPIVFSVGHDMTKQMRNIVTQLNLDEELETVKISRSIFGRLMSKKE